MSDTMQAPLGAELVDSGASSSPNSTPNTPSVDPSTPTPVKLTPDTMVDVDGKPVKFSDHVRGFQSQATKASQRAAQLERQLAEREAAIQRYEAAQRAAQRPQPGQQGQQGDPLASLRELPYLSGQEAAQVVQSIASEINARDQIILGALKQIQALQRVVGGLHQSSSTASFDAKIANWLREGGYPDEYSELAKDIYAGYEGDDLDTEFPRIFAERVQMFEAAQERRRQIRAEQARRTPFVPGKGGTTNPSRPLTLNPRNSARQDADALWEAIQAGQGT